MASSSPQSPCAALSNLFNSPLSRLLFFPKKYEKCLKLRPLPSARVLCCSQSGSGGRTAAFCCTPRSGPQLCKTASIMEQNHRGNKFSILQNFVLSISFVSELRETICGCAQRRRMPAPWNSQHLWHSQHCSLLILWNAQRRIIITQHARLLVRRWIFSNQYIVFRLHV